MHVAFQCVKIKNENKKTKQRLDLGGLDLFGNAVHSDGMLKLHGIGDYGKMNCMHLP